MKILSLGRDSLIIFILVALKGNGICLTSHRVKMRHMSLYGGIYAPIETHSWHVKKILELIGIPLMVRFRHQAINLAPTPETGKDLREGLSEF